MNDHPSANCARAKYQALSYSFSRTSKYRLRVGYSELIMDIFRTKN